MHVLHISIKTEKSYKKKKKITTKKYEKIYCPQVLIFLSPRLIHGPESYYCWAMVDWDEKARDANAFA